MIKLIILLVNWLKVTKSDHFWCIKGYKIDIILIKCVKYQYKCVYNHSLLIYLSI